MPVVIFSTRVCPYCRRAEALLNSKGVTLQKIMVDEDAAQRAEMVRRTGRRTVPQIFIGTTYVGGFVELAELERSGELDVLLSGA